MKEEAKRWLTFAQEDLKVAELVLEESIYNQVCFHSQQAGEKALKALIEEKVKVPKEHRLPKLFKICQELGYNLEKFQENLEFLDKFYTFTRYPFIVGMLPEGYPTKEDALKALGFAKEIYSFVVVSLTRDK